MGDLATEEARALGHRLSAARRRQAEAARAEAVYGSPIAYRALRQHWAPWLVNPLGVPIQGQEGSSDDGLEAEEGERE